MLIEKLKRLFGRKEIPTEARDLLRDATTPRQLLHGLDELIARNEVEVQGLNRDMESLEGTEHRETGRVRSGELGERTKNNVLRRIQRLRQQMDNLEERQRIYNRNINLLIRLVGRIQALEAMELRGVDEDQIDSILSDYEEEFAAYRNVLDTEELLVSDFGSSLDDSQDLSKLEAEILGEPTDEKKASPEKEKKQRSRTKKTKTEVPAAEQVASSKMPAPEPLDSDDGDSAAQQPGAHREIEP